ncbi:MAG TPA: peptidyl-prolyl cis-trans isomerase [Bryobacteraceae bacterium]
MFDLFRSQQKAVRILLGVLLGMVAISMLLYLIPGAGTPTGNRDDQVVAEIDKEPITIHDVELQIRNITQNRQISPDVVQVLVPQLIDQAIADRAMAYEAKKLGFKVSERDLANIIRSLGPISSLTPQQYRMFVEQQGFSVPEFENNVLLKAYQDSIQNIAMEGVIVTPAEVEAAYKQTNDRVKLEYIPFDAIKLGSELKPTTDELKKYFNERLGVFNMPETHDLQFIVVDPVKVAETIQVADSQVQSFYNSHKDQFRIPERVKVRHIMISTAGKPKDELPKLKAKAEDLLKQVKAGGDFSKLAEKNSDDTTSGKQGGDLGWIVRGQMQAPDLETATFALKPNEISNLIATQYGYDIVQVLEKEQARLRPMEEVRSEILGTLRQQVGFDRMQTLADQAHAELAKSPQGAEQIAKKLGLEFDKLDKWTPGGAIPPLSSDPQATTAVQALKKGDVSQVLQASGKLAVAVVTNVNPIRAPDFAEVEARVRAGYAQDKGTTVVAEKSKKAAELAKSNGGDLKAVAKSMGLEMKSTELFTRNGAVEGLGGAAYLSEAFDKPVGTILGPIFAGAQTIVAKVSEKQAGDMAKFAAERDGLLNQLKGRKSAERQALLQDSILNTLIQQKKIKKHQDVINRLMSRYRS